jgi:endo-1,4-beta-mannosidase
VLDYLDQPDHLERWGPLVELLDSALGYWIDAQAAPLWLEDPTKPVTVGYNDLVLASRPANRSLDAVTFHQYQAPLDEAPAYSASLSSQIAQHTGRPAVLGEFGWSTHEVEPPRAAELEAATFAAAVSVGLVGGYKWMLNDATNQPNPREAAFGLFRADGSAKPSAMAIRELALA